MPKDHLVAMRVQVFLLTIKPVNLHIVAILELLVLLNLNHAQMVKAAADQALHPLLLQLCLV